MYRKHSQTGRFATAGVQHLQKDAKPTAPAQIPDPVPQRPIEESVFRPPKSEKRKKKYQRG